jgi:hypothetical protein
LILEEFSWWKQVIWSWDGGDMDFQGLSRNNIYVEKGLGIIYGRWSNGNGVKIFGSDLGCT